MPSTVNNFLSVPPPNAPPTPKPKDASGSADFRTQLKDAQDKPAARDAGTQPKPVSREVGKSSRITGGSKTKARPKAVKKEAGDEPAADETAKDPAAEESNDAEPSPVAATDPANPAAKGEAPPEKAPADPTTAAINSSQPVNPAIALPTPPPTVLALREKRLQEMRSHSPTMTPYAAPSQVKPTAGDAAKGQTDPAAAPEAAPTPQAAVKADTSAEPLQSEGESPVPAKSVSKAAKAQATVDAAGPAVNLIGDSVSATAPAPVEVSTQDDTPDPIASLLPTSPTAQKTSVKDTAEPDASPAPAREAQFAEANHANIVSGVRANLAAHGGSMEIRLDPPELGALQVSVEMRNGTVTATFQTSNDDATRLLGHSLGQLKAALESQGVTVDKISVQQAPRDQKSQGDSSQQQQQSDSQMRQDQQREQQRREMLQRMWQRVSGAPMPVDLVA